VVRRSVLIAALALSACGSSDGASGDVGPALAGSPAPAPATPGAAGAAATAPPDPTAPSTPSGMAGAPPLPPAATGGGGGDSTMSGTGGAGSVAPPPSGPGPTTLPSAKEPCPTLADGDAMLLGKRVRIWIDGAAAAASDGPLVFYWHGTGSNPSFEAPIGLGPAMTDVVAQGGIVAGFYSEACQGCRTTGNNVWYYEDFERADEVLACAIEQVGVDTRHIHTAGMSAGGLQASAMVYARSSYLASATSYSGGIIGFVTDTMPQDPANKVAAMIVHGGASDQLILRFEDTSKAFKDDLVGKGHFAFLCDHGMGHTIPMGIGASTWQFFQDHAYGADPSPYAGGLPASFPAYCAL
jgi:predicted esterase